MAKGHTTNKKVVQEVQNRSEGLCEFPMPDGTRCNCNYMVEHHHVYGASNRKKMEMKETVYDLCYYHHKDSKTGVHFNKENKLIMRRIAIAALMLKGWTQEKILAEAGRWDGE